MQAAGSLLASLLAAAALLSGCGREPAPAARAEREVRATLAALTSPGKTSIAVAEHRAAAECLEAIAAAEDPRHRAELEEIARRYSGADPLADRLAFQACWALWRTGTAVAWFEREALAAYPEHRALCAHLVHVAAYEANEEFLEPLAAIQARWAPSDPWEGPGDPPDAAVGNAIARYIRVVHLQRRLASLGTLEDGLALLAPVCAGSGSLGSSGSVDRRSPEMGRSPDVVWVARRLDELSGASPDAVAGWAVEHDWGAGELAVLVRCGFLDSLAPACLARVFELRPGWEAELAAWRSPIACG